MGLLNEGLVHVSHRAREGITFNNDDVITQDTPRIVEGAAGATFGRRQAKSLVRGSLTSYIQGFFLSSHGGFQLATEGAAGRAVVWRYLYTFVME